MCCGTHQTKPENCLCEQNSYGQGRALTPYDEYPALMQCQYIIIMYYFDIIIIVNTAIVVIIVMLLVS